VPALSSSTWGLSRVRRVGVRLAHYDIRALGNTQALGLLTITWIARTRIPLLVVPEHGGAPPPSQVCSLRVTDRSRAQDSRVGRRIVADRRASD